MLWPSNIIRKDSKFLLLTLYMSILFTDATQLAEAPFMVKMKMSLNPATASLFHFWKKYFTQQYLMLVIDVESSDITSKEFSFPTRQG